MRRLIFLAGIVLLSQTTLTRGENGTAVPPQPDGKATDGIFILIGRKYLNLEICSEDVIRVSYSGDANFYKRLTLAADPGRHSGCVWDLVTKSNETVITTAKLKVHVARETGAVSFYNASNQLILAEMATGRTLTPAIVRGDQTFHVRQKWQPNPGEALYGLGQHPLGLMSISGYDLDFWQYNGTVAIPFLISSRGYGILWDNTSFTRFGDLRDWKPIPSGRLFGADGHAGGLTGFYYAGTNFEHLIAQRQDATMDFKVPKDSVAPNASLHPGLPATGGASMRWEGEIQAKESGDYQFQTFSNYGVKFWLDGQPVISAWHQRWQPLKNQAKVHLAAGRHQVKLEWTIDSGGQILRLLWKTPSHDPNTSLWSEVGDGIDYYFCYGPELDRVIAGYRSVTGRAPNGFRSRHSPVDTIVQDWFYDP